MATDSSKGDSAMALPSSSVAGTAGDVTLPRFSAPWARVRLPRVGVALGPVAGRIALASVLVAALVPVLTTTAGPPGHAPRSTEVFPGRIAGP
jgi:hypothetical protein